jgi:hypothetical protein
MDLAKPVSTHVIGLLTEKRNRGERSSHNEAVKAGILPLLRPGPLSWELGA